ncbi:hypothetical protein BC834DRAFT_428747 [Gloeopeniophorella convolvens]|nr:hypothetical protein BC834DRAFT_428747 [Gloeopeniophorella convolvens]
MSCPDPQRTHRARDAGRSRAARRHHAGVRWRRYLPAHMHAKREKKKKESWLCTCTRAYIPITRCAKRDVHGKLEGARVISPQGTLCFPLISTIHLHSVGLLAGPLALLVWLGDAIGPPLSSGASQTELPPSNRGPFSNIASAPGDRKQLCGVGLPNAHSPIICHHRHQPQPARASPAQTLPARKHAPSSPTQEARASERASGKHRPEQAAPSRPLHAHARLPTIAPEPGPVSPARQSSRPARARSLFCLYACAGGCPPTRRKAHGNSHALADARARRARARSTQGTQGST